MKKKWKKSLYIFITIILTNLPTIICDNFDVVVKELPVGVLKNYTIDNTVEYIIEIKNLSQVIKILFTFYIYEIV